MNTKTNIRLNSGIDMIAWMTKRQTVLAKLRALRVEYFTHRNACHEDQFTKRQRQLLNQGVELGLVAKYGTVFQFFSEEKAVKTLINQFNLSVSSKIHIYSSAITYRFCIDELALLQKTNNWKDLSFAISVHSFSEHTGQQKIAGRLALSRQSINKKCKSNKFIKVQNKYLKVGKAFDGSKNLAKFKNVLGTYRIGGYKVGPDGNIYRQLPNDYSLKKIKIIFNDFKTFRFSNRKLNESFFADASLAALPKVKRLALLRAKRKTRFNRNGKGNRAKEGREIHNVEKRNSKQYGEEIKDFKAAIYRKKPGIIYDEVVEDKVYRNFKNQDLLSLAEKPSHRTCTPLTKDLSLLKISYVSKSLIQAYPKLATELNILEKYFSIYNFKNKTITRPLKINRGSLKQVGAKAKSQIRRALEHKPSRLFNLEGASHEMLPFKKGFDELRYKQELAAKSFVTNKNHFFDKAISAAANYV